MYDTKYCFAVFLQSFSTTQIQRTKDFFSRAKRTKHHSSSLTHSSIHPSPQSRAPSSPSPFTFIIPKIIFNKSNNIHLARFTSRRCTLKRWLFSHWFSSALCSVAVAPSLRFPQHLLRSATHGNTLGMVVDNQSSLRYDPLLMAIPMNLAMIPSILPRWNGCKRDPK